MTVTSLLDLEADVLPHLNMTGLPEDGGAELQGFIDDTAPVIEDIVGHVIPATFDEFYDGGNVCIYLRETPILSVTSIAEIIGVTGYNLTQQAIGQAVDDYGFTIDVPRTGRITRRNFGSGPSPFYANVGNIEVVYVAGLATVPRNVRMGALELVRDWFQNSQEGRTVSSYSPGGTADDSEAYSSTPSGYLVSNRVKAALQPNMRPLVIA